MLKYLCALLSITVCCVLQKVVTLEVPQNPCPDNFGYLCYDNKRCFGKITLNGLTFGTKTTVELEVQSHAFSTENTKISLYDDINTTEANLINNLPVLLRLDFPDIGVLPGLRDISVDGKSICALYNYPTGYPLFLDLIMGPRPTVAPDTGITTNDIVTNPTRPTIKLEADDSVTTVTKSSVDKKSEKPSQNNDQSSCGQEGTTAGFVPFIHGGMTVRPGQFPWLSAIYSKSIKGTAFLCGGSLISARTVLTAAHCFRLGQLSADKITVYLGRYSLIDFNESGAISRDIEKLIIHPEYDPRLFQDADIAMLHLYSPVSFTEVISPICLWKGPDDLRNVVNVTAHVAGWGGENSEISAVPKVAPATIVSEATCRRSSDLLKIITSSRTICAGQRDGVGPCMGDSGAGLMIKRDGTWYLRGIVSAGHTEKGACNLFEYVVYCDAAKFSDWVHENML